MNSLKQILSVKYFSDFWAQLFKYSKIPVTDSQIANCSSKKKKLVCIKAMLAGTYPYLTLMQINVFAPSDSSICWKLWMLKHLRMKGLL